MPERRRFPSIVAPHVAFLLVGCASLGQLTSERRWGDACEKAWGDETDEAFVVRAMAGSSRANYRLHVFEPSELEELLSYVPAKLASGEVVLVESRLHVDTVPTCSISAAPELRSAASSWHRFECCDTGQWLTLDGREEEWRRIQKAETDAKIAAERRRERYAGRFGGLRFLWDTMGGAAVGMGRDLFWIGTAGTVDLDVSDVRGAELSPGGFARVVRQRIESAMERAPEPDGGSDAADKRRAAAALTLSELVRGGTGCAVHGHGECTSYSLLDANGALASAKLTTTFGVCAPGAAAACFVRDEAQLPLPAGGSAASRVNAAFAAPLALDQLLK